MKIVVLILLLGMTSFTFEAKADKMRTFLVSSGFGTVIGAGVGLVSLAFADNPSGRINNVARGASLGLYVGMGVGFYLNGQSEKSSYDSEYGLTETSSFYVTAQLSPENKVTGGNLHWMALQF